MSSTMSRRSRFSSRDRYLAAPTRPPTPPPSPPPDPPQPLTLEAIRRKVQITLNNVEKDIQVFKKKWLNDVDTDSTEKWIEYTNTVLLKSYAKQDKNSVISQEAFVEVLNSLHDTEKLQPLTQTPEFTELKQVCERDAAFRAFRARMHKKMKDAILFHTEKCCVSFIEESDDPDLYPIKDYEDEIVKLKLKIRNGFEHLESLNTEIQELRISILSYLGDYDKIIHCMDDTMYTILQILKPARRWLDADKGYLRRLENELLRLNQKKAKLKEELKQLDSKKVDIKTGVFRRSYTAKCVEKRVREKSDEQILYRRRQMTARDNYGRLETQREKKAQELKEIQVQIIDTRKSRPPSSKTIEDLLKKQKIAWEELQSLQRRSEKMKRDMFHLKNEKKGNYIEFFELDRDFISKKSHQKAAYVNLTNHSRTMSQVNRDIETLDGKIGTLKKVRETKTRTATIEKIYQGQSKDHLLAEMKAQDRITHVFKLVSSEIGREWPHLYMDLPFDPPRDFHSKSRDIEVIDLNTYGLDSGWQEMAMRSLERWRRLSRVADVKELLISLKKLRKMDMVRKVEQYMLKSEINDIKPTSTGE